MSIDFYVAILTGWSILLIFWMITILFLFIRNPQKTNLIKKINFQVLLVFFIGFVLTFLFS